MSISDFNVEAIEKELEENPGNTKALGEIAQYYAYKGEYNSAIRYYEKIVRINENYFRAWSALGHCYLLKQEYQKSINAYHKSLTNAEECKDIQVLYGVAMLYYSLKEWKQAEIVFKAILRMEIENNWKHEIFLRLGIISAKEKEYQNAIVLLEKSLEFPNIPIHKKSEILVSLGETFSCMNFFEKAKKNYDLALTINPDNIKTIKNYAWNLFLSGRYEQAKDLINNSLQKTENSFDLFYIQGRIYQALQDFENARLSYSSALSLSNSCICWISSGILYAEAVHYIESYECFVKAININQDSWETWNNIAILYELCGQKLESDLSLQKAQQLSNSETLSKSFIHPVININEPINKHPLNEKTANSSELFQQLDKNITKEITKILEKITKEEAKNEPKPEIIVPKVSNSTKPEKNQKNDKLNPSQMAMFQSLVMNPMLFYQMMMGSLATNGSVKQENQNFKQDNQPLNEENPKIKQENCIVKEENESEQIAKALMKMTEEKLRKKRKNSDDPEEPHKKQK